MPKPMAKLAIAVVGAGVIGCTHIETIAADGMATLAATLAVREAARTGRAVVLNGGVKQENR